MKVSQRACTSLRNNQSPSPSWIRHPHQSSCFSSMSCPQKSSSVAMRTTITTTTTRRVLFIALLACQLLQPVKCQNNTEMPTFAPAVANDTVVPTLVPTLTPTTATTNAETPPSATTTFPPCSLCPVPGQNVTNFTGRFNERTCEAYQMDATQGILSPEQCSTLRESVSFQAVCDCATTSEEEPEGAVTNTPTSSPTLGPTVSATTVNTIETTVVMVLSNVTVPMSPVHRNYFGPQLALYLERELRRTTSLAPGWEGQLESQLLLDTIPSGALSTRRRQQRTLLRTDKPEDDNQEKDKTTRDLQITVSAPLATRTIVKAKQNAEQPPLGAAQLELFVTDLLLADGGAGFLAQLLNTTSPTLLVYFEKIQDVTIFPSDSDITEGPGRQTDIEDDGDDDGFFTLWVIVGIAGGVGFCLLVVALVLLCVMQPETVQNSPRAAMGSPRGGFSTSPTKTSSNNKAEAAASDVRNDGPAEDDTTYYGNASILNPPTVNQHDDNQSYAYSLDPGTFDNGTVSGGQQSYEKSNSQQGPSSSSAGARGGRGGAADAPSLAPDDSRSMYTARRGQMVLRDIQAPPGKLGIVIDTSLEGPVVHKVNENSPLLGKIFAGDIITSINGIDTRAMKASAITGIMVRTAHEPRALTVASEDTTMK